MRVIDRRKSHTENPKMLPRHVRARRSFVELVRRLNDSMKTFFEVLTRRGICDEPRPAHLIVARFSEVAGVPSTTVGID
jgi:hypothetical protein